MAKKPSKSARTKSSAQSAIESIKALTQRKSEPVQAKSAATPPIEKLKTGKEIKTDKKEVDGRGGAREGSGRKPGGTSLARRLLRTMVQEHYTEEVEVKVKDPKTGIEHVIKKPRVVIAIDALFQVGVQTKDATALDKYLNRALGKAPQPLIGDEDEDPVQVDLGVGRILDKAYGDDEDED